MQRDEKGHFVKGHNTPHSEKTRLKISESSKGKNTWSKGKKASEETRQKMRDNSPRYWERKKRAPFSEGHKDKVSKVHLGRNRPEETKAKMKANSWSKGKFAKEHPCWVEEKKNPLNKSIRHTFKYVEWRNTVFIRDNFTCVLCGMKGYMEADHYPIRFIDILKKNLIETIEQAFDCLELWDTNNGRTLCKPCHLKTPTWGRKKTNYNTAKK